LNCRDVPVHLVAGEHDGVIPASNIRHHYAAMRAAGMDVSYREVRVRRWPKCAPAIFQVLC
jgi:predicted esterase